MLNYRTARVAAIIILASIVILNLFYEIGYLPYIILFLLSALIIFYGSAFINSGFYFKMICSFKTKEKIIAITFDDGPTHVTTSVLDVLKKYNVKAAFFLVGRRVHENAGLVKRIYEEGHLVGNHSYSHDFWFPNYASKRIYKELYDTSKIIKEITGREVNLFRPPCGVTNPAIKKAVEKMNLVSVGWSLKSKDTVIESSGEILERLKNKVKAGDIILMHDTDKKILQALTEFLDFVYREGYKVVRLDELINVKAYK